MMSLLVTVAIYTRYTLRQARNLDFLANCIIESLCVGSDPTRRDGFGCKGFPEGQTLSQAVAWEAFRLPWRPWQKNGGMKPWVLVCGVQGGSFMESWMLVCCAVRPQVRIRNRESAVFCAAEIRRRDATLHGLPRDASATFGICAPPLSRHCLEPFPGDGGEVRGGCLGAAEIAGFEFRDLGVEGGAVVFAEA